MQHNYDHKNTVLNACYFDKPLLTYFPLGPACPHRNILVEGRCYTKPFFTTSEQNKHSPWGINSRAGKQHSLPLDPSCPGGHLQSAPCVGRNAPYLPKVRSYLCLFFPICWLPIHNMTPVPFQPLCALFCMPRASEGAWSSPSITLRWSGAFSAFRVDLTQAGWSP